MLNPEVPLIELPRRGVITVRVPPIPDTRHWFFDHFGWRIKMGPDPDGLGGVTLPRAHLDRTIGLLLTRWKAVDLYRQYQPNARCAHRCRTATKLLCTCSCSGEQHSSLAPERPELVTEGDFDLIGTGLDDWSLVRVVHQRI